MSRGPVAAAVTALILGGVWLRLARLGSLPGVNGDEAWMGVQALRLLAGDGLSWRTPTGNPLNPFLLLPLVASHAIADPSFAHLRWVAAASGVAVLATNALLCRLAFGVRTAVITTVALAVLPDTIAYSRFGWDSSQSVLFTLPVLYLPLAAWHRPRHRLTLLAAAALAWAAAVLVHPTNLFVAPLLVVPALGLYGKSLLRRILALPALSRVLLAAVALACTAGGVAGVSSWTVGAAAVRAVSGEQLVLFLGLLTQLFSGMTVYRYIPGTLLEPRPLPWVGSDLALVHAGSALVLVAVTWGIARLAVTGREARDRALLAGVLCTMAGFYLVAGPDALRPHVERYGQCLIAGGVLLAGRGAEWYLMQPRLRPAATAGLLSLAGLSLAGFLLCYWLPLSRGTSMPHPAFRTADVEPKAAALARVLEERGSSPTIVGAGSWWSYWPLAYLAAGHSHLSVVSDGGFGEPAGRTPPDCWIELVDTPEYASRASEPGRDQVRIADPAGREVLSLFCVDPRAPRSAGRTAGAAGVPTNSGWRVTESDGLRTGS